MVYRLLFKDHGDQIFGSEAVEADNDRTAVEIARRLFRNGIGAGYEIWRGDQHIHTEPPTF